MKLGVRQATQVHSTCSLLENLLCIKQMASFDSAEDLAITKAWAAESRVQDRSSTETFWTKIHNKFSQDSGNPKRRSVQQIMDRHYIILDAVAEFFKIKHRIWQASHLSLSPLQLVRIFMVYSSQYLSQFICSQISLTLLFL